MFSSSTYRILLLVNILLVLLFFLSTLLYVTVANIMQFYVSMELCSLRVFYVPMTLHAYNIQQCYINIK